MFVYVHCYSVSNSRHNPFFFPVSFAVVRDTRIRQKYVHLERLLINKYFFFCNSPQIPNVCASRGSAIENDVFSAMHFECLTFNSMKDIM